MTDDDFFYVLVTLVLIKWFIWLVLICYKTVHMLELMTDDDFCYVLVTLVLIKWFIW